MHFTIFYAWQSDRPEKTNKYFIQKAAESAITAIRADAEIYVAPSLDHDTKGVPGIPDIPSTICEKIDRCGIFLADMTFSGNSLPKDEVKKSKYLPNPNVLIELGYALARVGPSRIIYVMNTAYGPPEELPFDIRVRRHPIGYNLLDPKAPNRAEIQRTLAGKLKDAIRTMVDSGVLIDLGKSTSGDSSEQVLGWRKQSAERLWRAVLALREATPEVLFNLDIATEAEYASQKRTPKNQLRMRGITNEVVNSDLQLRRADPNIEEIRPIIGDTLWQMFSSYQAFLIRVCLLTVGTLGNGGPWYRDEGALSLLARAVSPKVVAEIMKRPLGQLGAARHAFETDILRQIRSMLPEGTVVE